VERLSIFGTEIRMGPLALLQYAEKFQFAASALPQSELAFDPVRLYLTCHSIELALKAFLSLHSMLMLALSEGKFAHNLESIAQAAEEKGLREQTKLLDCHMDEIRKANLYYIGKVFEYPAVGEAIRGFHEMPSLPVLLEAAVILVSSLRQPCLEAK